MGYDAMGWSRLENATNKVAGTYYYAVPTKGKTAVGLQLDVVDCTVTLEATLGNTDAGDTPVWVDVTKSAKSLKDNSDGAASFGGAGVTLSDIVLVNGLVACQIRLKVVTTDATNTVRLHAMTV